MKGERKKGVEAAQVGFIEFWQINFNWNEIELMIAENEKEFQRKAKGEGDREIKTVVSVSD